MEHTLTIKGKLGDILDIIDYLNKSRHEIKHDTTAPSGTPRRCCFHGCVKSEFASYRNLEQHVAHKHNETLESLTKLANKTKPTKSKAELREELAALLEKLRFAE